MLGLPDAEEELLIWSHEVGVEVAHSLRSEARLWTTSDEAFGKRAAHVLSAVRGILSGK